MSWFTRERGEYTGKPVWLYRFSMGTTRWLYSGGDKPVTFNNEVYAPAAITHGGVSIGADTDRDSLAITMPRNADIPAMFYGGAPEGVLSLVLYEKHDGDDDYVVRWQGRLVGFTLDGNTSAKLTGETASSSVKAPGLFAYFQVLCRKHLGDKRCRVRMDDHKQVTSITLVSGSVVHVASMGSRADGWADGGEIVGAGGTRRMVLGQDGNVLRLSAPVRDLSVGEAVTVYAGCDLTLATCRDKFGNYLNYGGFPRIPTVNLFSGASLASL